MNFPSQRPYQRHDADSEKFNTQSFSVFYSAHNRIIQALQDNLKDHVEDGYLTSDRQKLETLRDSLGIVGDEGGSTSKRSQEPSSKPLSQPGSKPVKSKIAPDGNCLYNAVIRAGGLDLDAEQLRAFATELLLESPGLLRKLSKYGSDLSTLIETICTNHVWAGDEGDLVPVVVAHYIKRPIEIYVVGERKKYTIQSSTQADPVKVFYQGDHYEAEPPDGAEDWATWERGVSRDEQAIEKPTQPLVVSTGHKYELRGDTKIGRTQHKKGTQVSVVAISGPKARVTSDTDRGWIPTSALDPATET